MIIIFHPDGENLLFQHDQKTDHRDIYENIERKFSELKSRGLNDEELELLVNIDIDKYFSQYIKGVNQRINKEDLANIIDPSVLDLAEKMVLYAEEQLQKSLNKKVMLGLALHIQTSIDRIRNGRKIINPQLNKIRKAHTEEFNVALTCIKMIEETFTLDLQIDEAAFLTMFFVLESEGIGQEEDRVEVMVIMHGSGVATAIAEVTNQLLSTNHAKAIDMPLHIEPKEIYQKVKVFGKNRVSQKGLLLLVDMGSLVKFGELLEKEIGIPVRVVSMVSTAHVLEATRRAIVGYSLDELYHDIQNLTSVYTREEDVKEVRVQHKKMAIITACLTGKGSAVVLKKMIANYLKFDEQTLTIIPVNLSDEKAIDYILTDIKKHHKIISIISNFPIKENVRQFNVEEVLSLRAVKMIQDIIDTEDAYLKMAETLKNHLNHIDDHELLATIRGCLDELQKCFNFHFNSRDLIGVVLHISCMVDRLAAKDYSVTFREKDKMIHEHYFLFKTIKESFYEIEKKYDIQITDDEVCSMMHVFDFKQEIPID